MSHRVQYRECSFRHNDMLSAVAKDTEYNLTQPCRSAVRYQGLESKGDMFQI